jgi:hypothetical protein
MERYGIFIISSNQSKNYDPEKWEVLEDFKTNYSPALRGNTEWKRQGKVLINNKLFSLLSVNK